jgi:hypothetical protein
MKRPVLIPTLVMAASILVSCRSSSDSDAKDVTTNTDRGQVMVFYGNSTSIKVRYCEDFSVIDETVTGAAAVTAELDRSCPNIGSNEKTFLTSAVRERIRTHYVKMLFPDGRATNPEIIALKDRAQKAYDDHIQQHEAMKARSRERIAILKHQLERMKEYYQANPELLTEDATRSMNSYQKEATDLETMLARINEDAVKAEAGRRYDSVWTPGIDQFIDKEFLARILEPGKIHKLTTETENQAQLVRIFNALWKEADHAYGFLFRNQPESNDGSYTPSINGLMQLAADKVVIMSDSFVRYTSELWLINPSKPEDAPRRLLPGVNVWSVPTTLNQNSLVFFSRSSTSDVHKIYSLDVSSADSKPVMLSRSSETTAEYWPVVLPNRKLAFATDDFDTRLTRFRLPSARRRPPGLLGQARPQPGDPALPRRSRAPRARAGAVDQRTGFRWVRWRDRVGPSPIAGRKNRLCLQLRRRRIVRAVHDRPQRHCGGADAVDQVRGHLRPVGGAEHKGRPFVEPGTPG